MLIKCIKGCVCMYVDKKNDVGFFVKIVFCVYSFDFWKLNGW